MPAAFRQEIGRGDQRGELSLLVQKDIQVIRQFFPATNDGRRQR